MPFPQSLPVPQLHDPPEQVPVPPQDPERSSQAPVILLQVSQLGSHPVHSLTHDPLSHVPPGQEPLLFSHLPVALLHVWQLASHPVHVRSHAPALQVPPLEHIPPVLSRQRQSEAETHSLHSPLQASAQHRPATQRLDLQSELPTH